MGAFMLLWRQFLMEWKLYSRDKGAMFWTFAFPVLMLLGFGTIFRDGGGPKVTIVRIQSGAESPLDASLREAIEAQHVKVDRLSMAEAEAKWKDGKIPVMVEGPDTAPRLRVNAYLMAQGMQGASLVQQANLIAQAKRAGQPEPQKLPMSVESPGKAKATNYAAFLLPGLLGLNLLSMGLFAVGMVNVAYREKGKFKRLGVTPLPKSVFLGGQILHRLTVAALSAIIVLIVGKLAFNISNQGSYLLLALLVGLGTATFMAMGFALSSFANTSEVYAAISNLLFFPMMFLGGVYFTLDSAPKWLQDSVQLLPLGPFLKALRAVFNDGASLAGHGWGLTVIAAWALMSFLVAVKRFRFA
jgi:ABC-2 type transport system permease protein